MTRLEPGDKPSHSQLTALKKSRTIAERAQEIAQLPSQWTALIAPQNRRNLLFIKAYRCCGGLTRASLMGFCHRFPFAGAVVSVFPASFFACCGTGLAGSAVAVWHLLQR